MCIARVSDHELLPHDSQPRMHYSKHNQLGECYKSKLVHGLPAASPDIVHTALHTEGCDHKLSKHSALQAQAPRGLLQAQRMGLPGASPDTVHTGQHTEDPGHIGQRGRNAAAADPGRLCSAAVQSTAATGASRLPAAPASWHCTAPQTSRQPVGAFAYLIVKSHCDCSVLSMCYDTVYMCNLLARCDIECKVLKQQRLHAG